MADMNEKPGCSTDITGPALLSEEERTEKKKAALNCLVQGKRHLIVKDIPMALSALGESCQLLSEINGPLCNDNAEAHFFYAKALLEQSRLDLSVIDAANTAMADASGDEESSEDEEDREKEYDGNETNERNDGKSEESKRDAHPAPTEDVGAGSKVNEKQEEDITNSSPSAGDENMKNGETSNATEKGTNAVGSSGTNGCNAAPLTEEAEELSNLELAWEVAEVAKLGYSQKLEATRKKLKEVNETEKKDLLESERTFIKKLAETHYLLGEIATESEIYTQAVEDTTVGLSLLQNVSEPDDREIAQFHFQLGLALSFDKKFEQAVANFKTSIKLIEKRILSLSNQLCSLEADDTKKAELEAEIKELENIIPELNEKVNDTLDAEKELNQTKKEEENEKEIVLRNSPVKNPNPPSANDISHLVKKKKKAESSLSEEPPAKKICVEESIPNQDSTA